MSALFSSYSVSHEEMLNVIKKSWFEWKYLIDPHTSTGMHFAWNVKRLEINHLLFL